MWRLRRVSKTLLLLLETEAKTDVSGGSMQSVRDWMERSTRFYLCSQTLLNMSASKSKLQIWVMIQ